MTLIRDLRQKTGKSLTAFAIEIGMEPATLSLIERGKRPCKRNADKLANALEIEPVRLFSDYSTFRKFC
jgi:transcriptional regulator with XRE-family HTH domain